ncbi:MAG: hypothetical protein FWF57_02215 [Defluviitaleaceae bacterium]|nr:hypothetical protein [Defluviitaleaceae bacterium]
MNPELEKIFNKEKLKEIENLTQKASELGEKIETNSLVEKFSIDKITALGVVRNLLAEGKLEKLPH